MHRGIRFDDVLSLAIAAAVTLLFVVCTFAEWPNLPRLHVVKDDPIGAVRWHLTHHPAGMLSAGKREANAFWRVR